MTLLSSDLREELVEELYNMTTEIGKRRTAETDERFKRLLDGKSLGIVQCISMLNAWNEPNHGKVTPHANSHDS